MRLLKQLSMTLPVLWAAISPVRATEPDYQGSEVSAGEFYLYNVGTGMFLTAGASWGTDACVDNDGLNLTLAEAPDGAYTLTTGVGSQHLALDGGRLNMANGINVNWTVTEVDAANNIYTIKYSGDNGWLICDPAGTLNSSKNWNDQRNRCELTTTDPSTTNTYGQWKFVTRADRLAALHLSEATAEQPADVTFLMPAAKFIKDDSRNSNWKHTGNGARTPIGGTNTFADGNYNCEQYNGAAGIVNTYQVLTGLPKGKYIVECQGFYRHGNNDANTEQTTSLYAAASGQETSVLLPLKSSGSANDRGTSAANQFMAKAYPARVTVPVNVTSTGELTIGVKSTSERIAQSWACFDDFRLYYVGPLADYLDDKGQLHDAIATAQNYVSLASYDGESKAALSSAITIAQTTYDSGSEIASDYTAALGTLSTAINAFVNGYAADVISHATTGDVTAAVFNADFETNTTFARSQWKNVASWITLSQHWNGASTTYAERTNNGTISQTIKNVPAGTYRVVAALRANTGTIVLKANGQAAPTFTGAGNSSTLEQININGVQMPYYAASAFANNGSRGHQWRGVEVTLAEQGDLTISIEMTGSGWMSVDDIHLYDMSKSVCLNGISENQTVAIDKTVTCDVVTSNPNVFITSSAAIYNPAGAQLDNNLVGNCMAKMVVADNYSYEAPTNSFTATSLILCRTLQTGGYNTFAAPFDISSEKLTELGITAKQLTSSAFANGTLTLNFANATNIEAGKPYLVKVSANVVNPTFENVTVNNAATTTATDAVDFIPTLGARTVQGDAKSILFLGAGNKLYTPNNESSQIKGFRAYFQLKGVAATARTFRLDFGNGETTSIEHLPMNSQQSGSVYTLDGRRIEGQPAQKGVYIANGKKIVIK